MSTKPSPSGTALEHSTGPIIRVDQVSKHYAVRRGTLKALDDVSLSLDAGRTLGVVGESGCGKTTLTRLILRMEAPTLGSVYFGGRDVHKLDRQGQREFHAKVSAVFQDPYSSLNPRHRVEEIVLEPWRANKQAHSIDQPREHLLRLLEQVGLPRTAARSYPHEFSGGQRQRIAIARAISLSPELIVLDEPVSALDVSIRAQILNLLTDLREQLNIAYLFVGHDLGVVRHMSDEVAVIYLGAVVEHADVARLYGAPEHPYTRGLLAASLPPDPRNPNLEETISGELPSPVSPPSGCRFRTRCPIRVDRCAEERPALREVHPGHYVACHLAGTPENR